MRSFFVIVSDTTSQNEVNKHLEMGRDLLSRGQLQDALSHYHAAVGESDGVSKQHHV
jgi:DnaJ family protein C protein 3